MCQFTVYYGPHPMDSWDETKVNSLDVVMKGKYDRRYKLGDIIGCYRDGVHKGCPKHLILIEIPSMSFEDGFQYAKAAKVLKSQVDLDEEYDRYMNKHNISQSKRKNKDFKAAYQSGLDPHKLVFKKRWRFNPALLAGYKGGDKIKIDVSADFINGVQDNLIVR